MKAVDSSNFLGQLRLPEAASAHALWRKENFRIGILALERVLQPLRQRDILRGIAQEPAPHAKDRFNVGL
jgi:hypothetical protein